MSRKGIAAVCVATGIVGAVLGLLVSRALASGIPAPGALTYSGYLEDATGKAQTAQVQLEVKLWPTPSGGTTSLCPMPAAVPITPQNGRFSVVLPEACVAAVKANTDVYAEVIVNGSALGRAKIGAVPYAVEADHAVSADTATSATNATSAMKAISADSATSATHASSADTAVNASVLCDGNAGCGAHTFGFTWDGASWNIYVDTIPQIAIRPGSKTFVIPHPTDPEKYLVHATLEGPESAVFYRGSARLRGGVAEVTLPPYFEAATRVDGRTVLLTPKFREPSEPISMLAASGVEHGGFSVRAADARNPDQTFDWEVKAIRSDVPALLVEPRRNDVVVYGNGPYKYFVDKAR